MNAHVHTYIVGTSVPADPSDHAKSRNIKTILADSNSSRTEKYLAEYFHAHGYSGDYLIPFNVIHNGLFVLACIKDIINDDLVWLCNQIAADYKVRGRNDCRDNDRLCRAATFTKAPTAHYKMAQARGCCGSHDQILTNPLTSNSYWLGCNYGH